MGSQLSTSAALRGKQGEARESSPDVFPAVIVVWQSLSVIAVGLLSPLLHGELFALQSEESLPPRAWTRGFYGISPLLFSE